MDDLSSLVTRAQTGDLDAYARIVRQFQDMACGYAYSLLGDFHLAEDAAQEAFVEAYRDLPKLREPAAFPAWFRRIVFKHCDRLTRGKRVPTTPLEAAGAIAAGHPGPEGATVRRELTGKVLDAIKALPKNERVVTTLFYINGYSHKDISRFTSRPVGTIKRCLHDARRRLRKELIAMVEDELKKSRPGPEFTDRVVRKISRIRVWIKSGDQKPASEASGILLLTDSEKRSFVIVIGLAESRAIKPWLAGAGSPDALDAHTALVRALRTFGGEIKEVAIAELKDNTFFALLKFELDNRVVEVDCRPSDALNLAVRCNASIFVSEEVAQQCIKKRKDGKPMSPAAAWRELRQSKLINGRRSFGNISEVLQELERDPESEPARLALSTAAKGMVWTTPLVQDKTDALAKVEEWVARSQGTKHEGLAAGLLGAVYLWAREPEPKKAIPHLEKAHRLLPQDDRIAFDLATAYAMEKRTDDAFSILEKGNFPKARNCRNFSNLWDDPRFRTVVGDLDPNARNFFEVAQLGLRIQDPSQPSKKEKPTAVAVSDGTFRREMAKISPEEIRQLAERLSCGQLLRVEAASRGVSKEGPNECLILEVEGDRKMLMPLAELERPGIDQSLREFTPERPMTHTLFCNILRAAGIRADAAVLVDQKDSIIQAVLLVSNQRRCEAISMTAPAALSIAFTAKCPILIAECLAEKL